jgi:hypothetical protein
MQVSVPRFCRATTAANQLKRFDRDSEDRLASVVLVLRFLIVSREAGMNPASEILNFESLNGTGTLRLMVQTTYVHFTC